MSLDVKMTTNDTQVIFTVTGGTPEDVGNLATFLAQGMDALESYSEGDTDIEGVNPDGLPN